MRRLFLSFLIPGILAAQTPAKAPPCPAQSVLLTAQPIYGVGLTTLRNACPAFFTALDRWYAGHPSSSLSDFMAAIRGVPVQPPVVTPPPVVVPPPVVTPPPSSVPSTPNPQPSTLALYADDFSSYRDTKDWQDRFWVGPNRDWGANQRQSAITYDTVEKALRYDWPARSNIPCGVELTTALMPRLYPPPTGTKDVWVKFTTKESPNFETGKMGCSRAYKFFLLTFERYGVSPSRVGAYLGPASNTDPLPTRFVMDMVGRMPGDSVVGPNAYPLPGGIPSWGGQYHTWVLGLENIGGLSTFSVYLDGVLIKSERAPFLSGQTLGPGWAITLEMGANVNSGPDHAQSRWWREFGVFTSKPAGIP